MRYLNGLFTDGRWNAAHWIIVAFFAVVAFFLAIIGVADATASRGMGALFLVLGLAWLALVSVGIVTLLRRTHDIAKAVRKFEILTDASLHPEQPPPLPAEPRRGFAAEQPGEARLRSGR